MGVRVLLIEDDETIAEPLADGLRHFGLTVHHVANGADGLRGPHGDVVLLDLGLPDMDGIDVCRGIRRTSDVPIIILSARGEEADRVLGLELGADDYLAKPFSIRELVARIRAVSRRHQRPGNGVAGGDMGAVADGFMAGGTGGVVAGVVLSDSGVGTAAGDGARGRGRDRAGTDTGAAAEFEAVAGGAAYGSWAASAWDPAPESPARRESATGDGFGGRDRAGSRFEAGSDFAAVDDAGTEDRRRAGGEGEGSARFGADGVGHSAGGEYDWAAAPYDTPAPGTPTYAAPAPGAPAFGSPAPGASASVGAAYGTPSYATPSYATPPHGSPVHEPPPYEPPVYEPPMYEQAPPPPRGPSGAEAADDGTAPPPGPLVVDRRTRQVWVGEVPVALTPKEFELLALLTEDPGAVYSRQQILNRVWDDHYQGPTKTLDVHVATLRRKLGDPAWIQTLRGVGFRLAVRAPGPGQAHGGGRGPESRAASTSGSASGAGSGSGSGSGRHRTPEARAS
ncbi:winged helix-turn-helix domain-containing protein [Streptomyces sp. ID01-12c]|uniref:winged helix-turn-helix domain-containing protein n=1 Tax=Streptomyces caniscabiei TaxID=2746961 RepID=UPI001784F5BD|nr:winged helix-turn-helix domain-containing protein [Streptomyces caniscabiei]